MTNLERLAAVDACVLINYGYSRTGVKTALRRRISEEGCRLYGLTGEEIDTVTDKMWKFLEMPKDGKVPD